MTSHDYFPIRWSETNLEGFFKVDHLGGPADGVIIDVFNPAPDIHLDHGEYHLWMMDSGAFSYVWTEL